MTLDVVVMMPRSSLVVILGCVLAVAGCSAVAGLVGAPKIVSVTITAPAGLLVGDTATATAVALGDDGRDHVGRPRQWSSSDPTALSIDANGKMLALIGGRTVTITCEVDGTRGTAMIGIGSDDSRFGYALADQPTAAGPYLPPAEASFNSSGGTIEVTRSSAGSYSVRFAGLGRQPGQHDNVQVSAYSSVPVYCDVGAWSTSGSDLVVPVLCFDGKPSASGGTPTDSRFTVLALGGWAFGRASSLSFVAYQPVTDPAWVDTSAMVRNSGGGHTAVGHNAEGNFSMQFGGLGSTWAAAPAAVHTTGIGAGARRCRAAAYDRTTASFNIICAGQGGNLRDSPWTLVWLQQGRPTMRFGFAWATSPTATVDYTPVADFLINSSGGSVKARKTALGQYHVVFAGLGRTAGASETVLVSPLFTSNDGMCDILSWGNAGASDLFVDVACYDPLGAAVDSRFGVMVIQ